MRAFVRTTIDIETEIYEIASRRALDEGRSIGDVICELARRGLAADVHRPRRRLGVFAGSVTIAGDFDETPDDVVRSMEQATEPAE